MCLKLLYEVLEINWTAVFISYGCTPLKRGKIPFFEMEGKEMYSHTFKSRASCLKPSPEKLQGSVPTSPYWMFYLVIVWCEIHWKNCYQRNQITVSSSQGGSSPYWCKRVMSVDTHLLSLLLLELTENGQCLGYTQSYPWRCVLFYTSTLGYMHELMVLWVLFYRADVRNQQLLPCFSSFLPVLTSCSSKIDLSTRKC